MLGIVTLEVGDYSVNVYRFDFIILYVCECYGCEPVRTKTLKKLIIHILTHIFVLIPKEVHPPRISCAYLIIGFILVFYYWITTPSLL